jgi:uncharacterized lipoprotein YddW (UPF0748 family)
MLRVCCWPRLHPLRLPFFIAVLALTAIASATPSAYLPSAVLAPPVPREFRGAWLASVYNLDWPSQPGLPPATQRAELIRILDRAASLKLNALLLQIRPACDALYASPLEPWSPFLTGKMGRPPEPFYDPLEFAVTEAHRRGIELHTWFNPYRAHTSASGTPSADHISVTRPHLIRRYNGMLWLDPGRSEVIEHTRNVIMDVVRRYDIDGVHIDDYFYPYPDARRTPFPDGPTYAAYQKSGGKLDRVEWRLENTNRMVQSLYQAIKSEKPWVKFGISPFGIWKNGVPAGIKSGIDARNDIHGDSLHWLKMGWLDYFAPQLYWTIDKPDQSFPKLLAWWRSQNALQRHIWPGLATDRIGKDRTATEILRQIGLTRRCADTAPGHILWNFKPSLENRQGLSQRLQTEAFLQPALTPAYPWLARGKPAAPLLRAARTDEGGWTFTWLTDPSGTATPHQWILQHRLGDRWTTRILPASVRQWTPEPDASPTAISLFAVDRVGTVGPPTVLQASP